MDKEQKIKEAVQAIRDAGFRPRVCKGSGAGQINVKIGSHTYTYYSFCESICLDMHRLPDKKGISDFLEVLDRARDEWRARR